MLSGKDVIGIYFAFVATIKPMYKALTASYVKKELQMNASWNSRNNNPDAYFMVIGHEKRRGALSLFQVQAPQDPDERIEQCPRPYIL